MFRMASPQSLFPFLIMSCVLIFSSVDVEQTKSRNHFWSEYNILILQRVRKLWKPVNLVGKKLFVSNRKYLCSG
jgi:hypothetical protein